MNRLKLILCVVLLTTVVFSCKDDDDEATLSVSAALTSASKGWIIKSYTISPAFMGISDVYAQWDDCDKDDLLFFVSDGKYRAESGTLKCDSTEPTIQESGTWTLSSDNKTLGFTPSSGDPYEITVTSATATQLTFTLAETYNGVKYTSTITAEPKP